MTVGSIFIDTDLIQSVITRMMILELCELIILILPGLVIIWAASLGYGIFAGFEPLDWIMFAIMTVLMIIGKIAEHVAMRSHTLKKDILRWLVLNVLTVTIARSVNFPILRGILAGLLALFRIEGFRSKDMHKALVRTGIFWLDLPEHLRPALRQGWL
jgi:uncharacterized protein YqgC (DUF456 family)